nr:KilA-N domain-containing protein [Chromobacterium sp. ASV5]
MLANTFQDPKNKRITAEMLAKYFEIPAQGGAQQTPQVLAKSFNGVAFEFREDGYFNMTKAAKAYGKDLSNFWKGADVKPYVEALGRYVESTEHLVQAQGGYHRTPGVGTWAHPKLAVFFARWLDVEFAVWCDSVIDSLLQGSTTININVSTPPEVLQVPAISKALRNPSTYAANMELREELEEARVEVKRWKDIAQDRDAKAAGTASTLPL